MKRKLIAQLWFGVLLSALAFTINVFIPGEMFLSSFNISLLGLTLCIVGVPTIIPLPSVLVLSIGYPKETLLYLVTNSKVLTSVVFSSFLLRHQWTL